jgi:hypothetical protein
MRSLIGLPQFLSTIAASITAAHTLLEGHEGDDVFGYAGLPHPRQRPLGDPPLVPLRVLGPKHTEGHPAASELALDAVAVGQGSLKVL